MRHGGISNLTGHPWFSGFDWKAMQNLALEPPYVPSRKGDVEFACLKGQCCALPVPVEYHGDDTGWDADFDLPCELCWRGEGG
mmetsp:Transcript_72462/g.199833  ORF Transcript_72462/g.199833 Transcript_72462/m.199833 type:complete len:83 (-) Transcript_72462:309-557(-)